MMRLGWVQIPRNGLDLVAEILLGVYFDGSDLYGQDRKSLKGPSSSGTELVPTIIRAEVGVMRIFDIVYWAMIVICVD